MPDILAEAINSGEACGASVSEMMKDHLPTDQAENIFEDGPTSEGPIARSLPHPLIVISDRILTAMPPLSAVKTTISNPEQLTDDIRKYHDGNINSVCDCQICRSRQAAFQQQSQGGPIMVTPYRHNWLISGNHKDEQSDPFDYRNCCQIQ